MQSHQILSIAGLLIFSFGVNVPLGYLRETSTKFSLRWFVLIHLSIPFIVVLRSMLGFHWPMIPFTLACAILGQLVGGHLKRRSLP